MDFLKAIAGDFSKSLAGALGAAIVFLPMLLLAKLMGYQVALNGTIADMNTLTLFVICYAAAILAKH